MIINISGLFAWLVVLSFSTISLGAENEVIPLENGCKLIRPPENSTVPRPWVIFSDFCLHSCALENWFSTWSRRGVHQEFLVTHRKFHKPLIKRSWKLWPLLYNKLWPPICHTVSTSCSWGVTPQECFPKSSVASPVRNRRIAQYHQTICTVKSQSRALVAFQI